MMAEAPARTVIDKQRKPGFLLEPLGWVYEQLHDAIEADPTLIKPLFELDPVRLHLMALALSHMTGDVTAEIALMLLQGSKAEVLKHSLGHCPAGIDRILRHMPRKVFAIESYRKLVELINNPPVARYLHHCVRITERTITGLHSLPDILRRPAIMSMLDQVGCMSKFVDSLRLLASRKDVSFDLLAMQLASLNQPNQVAAKLRHWIDTVPLPEGLPPERIESFRRIDSVAEIRDIASTWRNCLASFVADVNNGTSLIYLSEQLQAVCLLARQGRMGWFVVEVKGPMNADLPHDQLREILDAFAAAGIPGISANEWLRHIIQAQEWPRQIEEQDLAVLAEMALD
jgi:hypothetical protein